MVTYEIAKTQDYAELIDMMSNAFITRKNEPTDFPKILAKLYAQGVDTMEHHFIAKEDGVIKANVGAIPIKMNICGDTLNVGGIGMVSVEAQSRSKGYMKVLMKNAVNHLRETGMDYGVLGGNRQRYEYFSFTPSGVCADFTFSKPNAIHLFGRDKTQTFNFVEVLENDPILEQMKTLYYAKMAYADREVPSFYSVIISWENTPYAVMKNGEFVGYIVVGEEKNTIEEIELVDISDLGEVLSDYFWNMSDQKDDIKVNEVQAFEVEKMKYLSLVAEWATISNQCNVAIFNFKTTIETFAKLKSTYTIIPDGNIVVEIKNMDKLEINVKDNQIKVERTQKPADLSLDYLVAVQVIFGAMSHITDFGVNTNCFAKSLFPLPLFLSHIDNV